MLCINILVFTLSLSNYLFIYLFDYYSITYLIITQHYIYLIIILLLT